MRNTGLLLLAIILMLGCSGNKHPDTRGRGNVDTTYTVEYAKCFTVKRYSDHKEVTVVDPWDSTRILQRYILVDKSQKLPSPLPQGTLIRIPLERVVAYSGIHCSTLNEIGVLGTVKGVCEPQHIDIDAIQEGIKKGTITNLGQATNPIIEKIVDIDPEAIFATPMQGGSYGSINKTGIPVIETPDYMEPSPLGRAEWIRFYSLFFDNETRVDSLFEVTKSNYNRIKEKVASVAQKPTVFTDLMFGKVWYTSGGGSFMAKMLNDAGATYIWADDNRITAAPLSFEQVLNKAGNARFWLVKYSNAVDLTYTRLENEYKPYSYFEAFKNRNIYECNVSKKKYYEDLPIHPDYLLADFASVFHPDLFPSYALRYYSKMKE